MSDSPATFHPDEALWQPAVSPWIIALVVTMATFMEVLDTSVANVALPHIAGNLSAGVDESTWVLTSYLVSNAVVLPLSGWLSERFGRKRFYMSCVALFTLSSLLCGLAPNLEALVFFRVLQGIGGGGLQPSEQAILADTFPPAKRGMAFAIYGMAVVAAPALGPTLGGWITDNFTWRWIFFINLPVGIVSLLLTARLIEDPPYLKARQRAGVTIDYIGFALIAIGLGFLQVVLDKGQREDWFETPYIRVFTAIFVVALIAAVIWELRVKNPVVDIRLFKDRTFLMGNVLLFMVGFALYSSTVLLPQFTQELLGYTAEQSGLVITPRGLTIMALMPLVGVLASRFDARKLLAVGFTIVALSLFNMTRFNLQIGFATMVWAMVFQAVGLPLLFVPINTAAYAYLPRDKSSAASGLINLSRNIGGSVGISFVTTMLARRAQFHQTVLVSHINEYDPQTAGALHTLIGAFTAAGATSWQATQQAYAALQRLVTQQATLQAFVDNFWLLGLSLLAMIPAAFLMKKTKPGGLVAAH